MQVLGCMERARAADETLPLDGFLLTMILDLRWLIRRVLGSGCPSWPGAEEVEASAWPREEAGRCAEGSPCMLGGMELLGTADGPTITHGAAAWHSAETTPALRASSRLAAAAKAEIAMLRGRGERGVVWSYQERS